MAAHRATHLGSADSNGAVLCLLGLLLSPVVLRSDTIFLKNGKRIVADAVTETGDKVYYENEYGRVSIPKSMVDRIEQGGAVPERRLPSPPQGVEAERQGA
ncbi:MAG: hypothetical protein HYX73_09225, partial [Acidobacteria bacterium]|nr:hypothetical protein [Acidobacteriota bacterium]